MTENRQTTFSAFEALAQDPEIKRMLQEQRLKRFRDVCPPEFLKPVKRELLGNAEAFDRVAQWDGTFPGPLASGATGQAKTRAAFIALGRLCVRQGKSVEFLPVKRLTEMHFAAHMSGHPQSFWRDRARYDVLLIDDLDKIQMDERNQAALFEFYDWVSRDHRPSVSTTNKGREWWESRMGAAFGRRLYEVSHFHVHF